MSDFSAELFVAFAYLNFSLSCDLMTCFCVFSKEPLTITRLENNTKLEKSKPLRRKTVADGFIAPILDTKSTQYPATKGTQGCEQL